jgi:hypothetical protein
MYLSSATDERYFIGHSRPTKISTLTYVGFIVTQGRYQFLSNKKKVSRASKKTMVHISKQNEK